MQPKVPDKSSNGAHKFPIELKEELDSPQRKSLFNPVRALKSMGIKPDMYVADIGCGTGFFTIFLSRLVGERGRVFAVDISKEMLRDVRRRIKKEDIKNVKVILSKENKIPLGSKAVDYCLLSSVAHELENKALFFKELKRILKERGEIGVIDWKKMPSPLGPPLEERIPLLTMKQIITKNGFGIKKILNLGKYNYAIVAIKI